MRTLLLVSIAGGLGTAVRFAVGRAFGTWTPTTFPWPTFLVNLIGCFLLGVIAEACGSRQFLGVELRTVLGVGVMGGLTTYSSFDIEMLRLAQQGHTAMALGYCAATLVVCLIGGALGMSLGRALA